jgi:hypothetical protein
MANTQGLPTYNLARTLPMAALYNAASIAVKAALYLASATTGPTNTAYTATGEVSGTNYSAGGVSVTAFATVAITSNVTYTTPGASIVFTTVTLSTAFDAVMLYDSGNSNRSLGVWTFGSQTITAGTFTLTMPTNDSTNALARWTWS